MTDPDTIITTMAQQREQERAADVAHYMLRKACAARAAELRELLWLARSELYSLPISHECKMVLLPRINKLLKEIDDATQ